MMKHVLAAALVHPFAIQFLASGEVSTRLVMRITDVLLKKCVQALNRNISRPLTYVLCAFVTCHVSLSPHPARCPN